MIGKTNTRKAVMDALESAGRGMSNICFNLSQATYIPADVRMSMKKAQGEWDLALRALLNLERQETSPPSSHVLKSGQPENGSERNAIEHSAILSSDLETLPVYDVVGHDLLRQYLPSGLDGFLVGVFERGELRAFRIFLKGAPVTNMEVILGHVVSILPIQNEAADSQFPPPPSTHVVGWQLQAHEVIQEVLRYNAACPNLPGDIIERLRRLDRTATTEGSNNG